jgi:drug/metabolite transporter (DMT)-like permease
VTSRAASSPATLAGVAAILLWGGFATLAALTGSMPPFQTTAVTFLIGGLLGVIVAIVRGRAGHLAPTPGSFLLGLYGFFAYHALYFAALKRAPPAEVQLVASLWALLIVLFAALLPGGRLRARHVVGGVIGLVAAGLLVWPRLGATADSASLVGLALAFGCALVWASYSVGSRMFAGVPSESLAVTSLATAALAWACHAAFETPVWPATGAGWLALVGLGVGPLGIAFWFWDEGMKRGDVGLLGVLSYAVPVVSTALLVTVGLAEPSWALALAAALMVVAGLVATGGGASADV